MKRKLKWWLAVAVGGIALLAGLIVLVNISFRSKDVGTASDQNKLRYVLVNQDQGGTFNQSQYNLGKDFVSLINQDSKNSWQVSPLDIANAGLDAGNYDAVIVLGPNFSRNLLSLEAANPQQAQISYRVRQDQNRINNVALKAQISDLLYTFNKRVVTMFFTSIMNNIGEAQQSVSNIVNSDNRNFDTLSNTILPPLQATPQSYKGLFSAATSLNDQNKMWDAQQGDFTKSTITLLQGNSTKLQNYALTLADYVQLQKNIGEINTANSQKNVQEPASADQKNYKEQFSALNQEMSNALQQLSAANGTGLLNDIHTVATQYQQQQQQSIEDIQAQIDNLHHTLDALQTQKRAIAEHYTGDPNWDITTASDETTKQAVKAQLLKLIDPSKDNMPAGYFSEIDRLVQSVSYDGLTSLLTTLHKKGFITDNNWTQYQNELAIIRYYAQERGISFGTQQSILDATASNPTAFSSTSTVTIDKVNPGQITLSADDGLTLQNFDAVVSSLQAQLNDIMTVSSDGTGKTIILTPIPAKPETPTTDDDKGKTGTTPATPDKDSSTTKPETKPDQPEKPEKPVITTQPVTLTLQWSWPSPIESDTPYTIKNYTVQYNNESKSMPATYTGSYMKYVTNLQADQLTQLVQELTSATSNLDLSATAVASAFGPTSGASQTRIDWLAERVKGGAGLKLTELADKTSLYQRLTDLPMETLQDFLDKKLIAEYVKELTTLTKDNADTSKRVTQVIGDVEGPQGLTAILQSLPKPELLLQQYERLIHWLTDAQRTIQEQYASWTDNSTLTVQSATYQDNNDQHSIYYDERKGAALYETFQTLISDTGQTAGSITSNATKVTSLTGQITTVTDEAKALQENTEKSLTHSDALTKAVAKQVKDNNTYNKNFNGVFKNAKPGEQNRNGVFSFLADPVRLTNEDSKGNQNALGAYLLVIITSIVMMLGAVFLAWLTRRTGSEEEGLIQHNIIERNLRPTGIVLVGALVLALAFTTIIDQLIVPLTPVFWVFIGGLFLASLLLLTYLWRQIGWLTLGLWAILFALYLVLAPVIGVVVAQNSWLGQIYRFLPFSLLEQGFGAILAQSTLTLGPLLVIAATALVAVLVNLVVWQKGAFSDAKAA
ncbi:type VII secretion protein EsaA [Schleiferilactobacillus perolens]|nr:type VII secretion protein EsaA [Schleiferilactobacillus perolens]